jgi:hypothetical protein
MLSFHHVMFLLEDNLLQYIELLDEHMRCEEVCKTMTVSSVEFYGHEERFKGTGEWRDELLLGTFQQEKVKQHSYELLQKGHAIYFLKRISLSLE